MSEHVQSALRDVMDEYEELRNARTDYARDMAVEALCIALQELQNAVASDGPQLATGTLCPHNLARNVCYLCP